MRLESSLKHFADTVSEQTRIITCRQCLHCHKMVADRPQSLSVHLRTFHREVWRSCWDEMRGKPID